MKKTVLVGTSFTGLVFTGLSIWSATTIGAFVTPFLLIITFYNFTLFALLRKLEKRSNSYTTAFLLAWIIPLGAIIFYGFLNP